LKPSWIRVELLGCDGIPPFGEIILGRVVGIVVAVDEPVVPTPSDALVGLAAAILDSTDSDVAVSVPVGLMLWGAVVEVSEDVTAGMTESDSELWGVELVIAGDMLVGATLFSVEEVSVDIGTPVLLLATLEPADADVSETVVGPVVGPLLGLL
jgi:hypothetical protein